MYIQTDILGMRVKILGSGRYATIRGVFLDPSDKKVYVIVLAEDIFETVCLDDVEAT